MQTIAQVKFVKSVLMHKHFLTPSQPCDGGQSHLDRDWDRLVNKVLQLYNPNGSSHCCILFFSRRLHLYWMVRWSWFARVNALCNLSCKKSQEVTVSFQGQFRSWRCFTLCITMEAEPWIAKQYKCHHCWSCKNYWGKGMEGGKKVSLPDTFWLQASRNAFKVGSVKFANSLSPPSIVKKVCTASKSSQGT